MQREAVIDTRGTAQALLLFGDPDIPPPLFTFHELVLTDGAGHDYGPHSEGAREALDESDRRIGRVLAALDTRGLFEETLFVVTSDHGMTAQNLDVSGHQAAWLVENAVSRRRLRALRLPARHGRGHRGGRRQGHDHGAGQRPGRNGPTTAGARS